MKTNANIPATALEATHKDFERMMQMLTGISNRVSRQLGKRLRQLDKECTPSKILASSAVSLSFV